MRFLGVDTSSALTLCERAIARRKKFPFPEGEIMGLNELGNAVRLRGDLPKSLQLSLRALEISKANKDREGEATSLVYIGSIYGQLKENKHALRYLHDAKRITSRINIQILALCGIGDVYANMIARLRDVFSEKCLHAIEKDSYRDIEIISTYAVRSGLR